jgi:RNA polymerase sigma-70 factor (ECF subfamily)
MEPMLRNPIAAVLLPLGASMHAPVGDVLAHPERVWAATFSADAGMIGESERVADLETDPHRALAEAAARGDRRAAEALLRALMPRVRNLVRYFVRGDAEVDDITQEAMVSVLRGLPGFRGDGKVSAWADRIVVRSVFAHIRRARVSDKRHVEYTPDLVAVSNDQSAHGFLARRKAIKALDEVPEEQREVLVMHHVAGLGVREIADELGIPFETVRSRLRLGMARLRNALGDADDLEAQSS